MAILVFELPPGLSRTGLQLKATPALHRHDNSETPWFAEGEPGRFGMMLSITIIGSQSVVRPGWGEPNGNEVFRM